MVETYPELDGILFDFLSQKEYQGNREPIARKVTNNLPYDYYYYSIDVSTFSEIKTISRLLLLIFQVMSAMFDPIKMSVKAVGNTVLSVPDQVKQ